MACQADSMVGPICAKNGKTYSHLCALKKAECKALSFIQVDFYGDCNTGGGELSRVHTTQTSPGSAQVFENLGLAHASVDAKNLGSA